MLVRVVEPTESAVRIADILRTGLEHQKDLLQQGAIASRAKVKFMKEKIARDGSKMTFVRM